MHSDIWFDFLGCPAWSQELNLRILVAPFQLGVFCGSTNTDSVKTAKLAHWIHQSIIFFLLEKITVCMKKIKDSGKSKAESAVR